ncbi:MAG: ABC transporter substrate-binding protein [Deltaproteobacteria bacterium]|nr:ABC transporter substrate-binding protein [Deltaproteobacteria bacterium]MBI2991929.1 ABC transporter substrate-binding protein [Deltaproteobacteria bacterium]
MTVRIAVPDLISNSYFPAIAAVELGFFKAEGLDAARVELFFPVPKMMEALREGEFDFVAGSAHATLMAFPEWKGAKLLAALAQRMYWLLIVRSDLKPKRGDIGIVKGLRIGAAPGVDLGLKRLLVEAGIDLERDRVRIAPVPGAAGSAVSFGLTAAKALEEGKIDGFWANAMGAEIAVSRGVGAVVLDIRRGDGPPAAWYYTFPALVTTEKKIATEPKAVEGAIRAVVRAQQALRADSSKATEVGRKIFPPTEAAMIAGLIERDLPYYDPAISEEAVAKMNRFARDVGLLSRDVPYDQVVATRFAHLWKE